MKFHNALIREIRERREMTILDVAFAMRQLGKEITPDTIGRWERGETNPDADLLPLLAKVLNVPLTRFFHSDDGDH